jgi:hypothetical protein
VMPRTRRTPPSYCSTRRVFWMAIGQQIPADLPSGLHGSFRGRCSRSNKETCGGQVRPPPTLLHVPGSPPSAPTFTCLGMALRVLGICVLTVSAAAIAEPRREPTLPIYCPCDGSLGRNGVMRGLHYNNDYMRHARK